MLRVRSGQPLPVKPSSRAQAGRRLRAARLMAGGVSLDEAAQATGLAFRHLSAIERGAEPLLDTDALALGELLGVPSDWLQHGWPQST